MPFLFLSSLSCGDIAKIPVAESNQKDEPEFEIEIDQVNNGISINNNVKKLDETTAKQTLDFAQSISQKKEGKFARLAKPAAALAITAFTNIPEEKLEKITSGAGKTLGMGIETFGTYVGVSVGLAIGTTFFSEFGGSIFGPIVGRLVGKYTSKAVSYLVIYLLNKIPEFQKNLKEKERQKMIDAAIKAAEEQIAQQLSPSFVN